MKKSVFGLNFAEEMRAARNTVLKDFVVVQNPDWPEDPNNLITPGGFLREIQRFLDICFDFSLKPLPHLCRYLDSFEWRFYDLNDIGTSKGLSAEIAITPHVITSCYMWAVYHNWHRIVCAQMKGVAIQPRNICWDDCLIACTWPNKVVRSSGGGVYLYDAGDELRLRRYDA